MSEILKPSELFDRCRFEKTGLSIPSKTTFKEWEKIGDQLKSIEGSVLWWLGDWVNFGETAYGEKYSQALEETGYDYGTLRDAAWVSKQCRFKNDNLSFSHHRQVASLENKDQEKWLDRAEREKWKVEELRQAIRDSHREELTAKAAKESPAQIEIIQGDFREAKIPDNKTIRARLNK